MGAEEMTRERPGLGLGVLLGAALAAVAVTFWMWVAIPAWHTAGDPLPGARLIGWSAVVAAVALVLAIGFVVAELTGLAQPVFVAVAAAAAAAGLSGILWRSHHRAELEDTLDAARGSQRLPDVPDLVAGFHFVAWTAGGVLVLTAVWALVRRRPNVRRIDPARLLIAASLATVAVSAVSFPIVRAPTPGPIVSAYHGHWGSGNALTRLGSTWTRIPAPKSENSDPRDRTVESVTPLSGGFVLASGDTVAGYSSGGQQRWSIRFPTKVRSVFGTVGGPGESEASLLVQTSAPGSLPAVTYGVNGYSGEIAWGSDSFGEIIDAAGTVTILRIGRQPTFAALVSRHTTSGDTHDVDLAIIDALSGRAQMVQPYKDKACAVPKQVAVIGTSDSDRIYSAAVVTQRCPGTASALRFFDMITGESRDVPIGTSGAIPSIADEADGLLAITLTDPLTGSQQSVIHGALAGLPEPRIPSGYTVTAILGSHGNASLFGATDPDGHLALLYFNGSKSIITRTKAIADPLGDNWATTLDEGVTAGSYADPQPVGPLFAPQVAPLTLVGIPSYPYSEADPMPVSVQASPCQQVAATHNRVYEIGNALLIWCNSKTLDYANEVYVIS